MARLGDREFKVIALQLLARNGRLSSPDNRVRFAGNQGVRVWVGLAASAIGVSSGLRPGLFWAFALQVRAYEAYWTQAECLIYTGQLTAKPDYYELQYVYAYVLHQLSLAQTSYVLVETKTSLVTRLQQITTTPFSAQGVQLARPTETEEALEPSVKAEPCLPERPCLCRQGGWCSESVTKLMHLIRHRPLGL